MKSDPELFYYTVKVVAATKLKSRKRKFQRTRNFRTRKSRRAKKKSTKTTGGCKVGIRVGTSQPICASTCAVTGYARCSHTATPTSSSWAGSSTVLSRRRKRHSLRLRASSREEVSAPAKVGAKESNMSEAQQQQVQYCATQKFHRARIS